MIAILGFIWLVGGFITSFLFRWLIPNAEKFELWVIACAALWPFTLPVFFGFLALSAVPKSLIKKFKKE